MAQSNSIGNESLPMPITQKAIRSARQFASEQRHPDKKEQVYFNTLAVLAVRDYLTLLDIETDLTNCDSWNPVVRLLENVADLYIKNLGKIECRPLISLPKTQKIIASIRRKTYRILVTFPRKQGRNASVIW
jgi:hypothetical protein